MNTIRLKLSRTPTDGCVYVIADSVNPHIKIGYSRNPARRLNGLQTAHASELFLMLVIENAGKDIEARLHDRFSRHYIRGEWFIVSGQVAGFLYDCKRISEMGHCGITQMAVLEEALERRVSDGWFTPIKKRISPGLQKLANEGVV